MDDEDLKCNHESDESMPDAMQTEKKRSKNKKNAPHHVLHQHTLRKPASTYFHLQLFYASPSSDSADVITVKRYLTSALQKFLGLHGAAIPLDILKLEANDVWIRVPREDATMVHEALSSWTGDGAKWVVKGRDEWLIRLAGGGNGQDLFKP